ncbi:hypothetical protein GPECTOR_5g108 [Gonium pectorale]|uniref:WSC domain-containing protein n=1 Tax=Gonium pectorale TaxID=33097 RepID=A0A150GVU5_GONPE|nr:hypothetical protein GPECTOR_5g108 [Gonium pectorale]|eukprot:KXZ53996.1 hypothetical protein GPECTOR_5g108 [Gonium pectorale]
MNTTLLDTFGGIQSMSFLYDDAVPGIVVAITITYGSGQPGSPTFTDVVAGRLYDANSPTLSAKPVQTSGRAALTSISVCCSAVTGMIEQLVVVFADEEQVQAQFAKAVVRDYPQIAKDVPKQVPNRVVSTSIVLLGPALPVLENGFADTLVATTRYGRGRVAAFGGEKMITQCCQPATKGRPGSDPGIDTLIVNAAKWASWYGTKVGGKAELRVADTRFVPMAKYIVKQAPETFLTPAQGKFNSYFLSLSAFMANGHQATDLYVIGAFNSRYLESTVQALFNSYIYSGKGVIFVGPDLMPPIITALRAPLLNMMLQVPQQTQLTQQTHPAVMWRLWSGPSGAYPVLDANDIPVNLISGPTGMVFSGYVSDPGGNLTLTVPSELKNAELAAQKYLDYLQGRATLSPSELGLVVSTVTRASLSLPRTASIFQSFWQLADLTAKLAATRPAMPPLASSFSPPPPTARPPPVVASPPPFPPPSPPASLATYLGCFPDDSADPIMAVRISLADRGNNPDRCITAAATAGLGVTFIGLRRTQCFGASSLTPDFVIKKLEDTQCNVTCPGGPQRCGGAGTGTVGLYSVYRVRHAAPPPSVLPSDAVAAPPPRPASGAPPPRPSVAPPPQPMAKRRNRRFKLS